MINIAENCLWKYLPIATMIRKEVGESYTLEECLEELKKHNWNEHATIETLKSKPGYSSLLKGVRAKRPKLKF